MCLGSTPSVRPTTSGDPRLLLFLAESDAATHGPAIVETLRHTLPREIRGYPTNFGPTDEAGVSVLQPVESGPVEHKVEVTTLSQFLQERLGITSAHELDVLDWLTFSEQALLEVTTGALFHDGLGTLAETRALLAYYPHDVWLYLLAAQWARISQQEPFVGRTGEVGDELGSALIAADLVQDVMRLGFLMERRYAPYSKWFGSAFARLACAAQLDATSRRGARRSRVAGSAAAPRPRLRDRRRHAQRARHHRAPIDPGNPVPRPTVPRHRGRTVRGRPSRPDPGRAGAKPAGSRRIDRPVRRLDRRSIECRAPPAGEGDLRKRLRRQDGKTARRQDGKTARR